MKPRLPRRRRDRLLAGAAALAVLAGAGTWTAAAVSGDAPAVHREDRVLNLPGPQPAEGAGINTSFFTSGDGDRRRPAVLLGHGFGGSKDDVRAQAERLARDGYAVMTWSARGFGRSGGKIGLNDPEHEVKDVSALIDWLARRPEVRLDADGDPRVGVAGASYGGAISLLAAGYDRRVDAIAPQITYWNLADSLFPEGVFKKLWTGIFFTTGAAGGLQPTAPVAAAAGPQASGCGRFEPQLCAMYERVAVAGKPDAEARELLERRSPSAVGDRIKVPTLIVQGQDDSLFPLDQADAMARTIAANGAPVSVDWAAGGHDGGMREAGRIEDRVAAWFDRYLKGDEGADTGPAFRVSRSGGIDSTDGLVKLRGASGDRYPGLTSAPREFALSGREQTFANPAGGAPPALSSLPGIGGQFAALGTGLSLDFPGQNARFESEPLTEEVRVTGTPTLTLNVRSTAPDGSAVLFGKVYDVGTDGRQQVLPSQLVAPVRVEDAGQGHSMRLRLPAIDHSFQAGHRLRVVVAATDLGYASPAAPASYTVSARGPLAVPVADGVRTARPGCPPGPGGCRSARWRWRGAARDPAHRRGPRGGAGGRSAARTRAGRRTTGHHRADEAVRQGSGPLRRAGPVLPGGEGPGARSARAERGREDHHPAHADGADRAGRRGDPGVRASDPARRTGAVAGRGVRGGCRVPAAPDGPGQSGAVLAGHRPAPGDAHMAEALEIAGLGDALERAVRTYSQGMRQRLAIAQAMLGMPDLLILDEPTNGLDPPQIREMRDVMIRYAAGGRTVIVSSHLLSEVEQSCTHLVVMDRGRLVRAGEVAEITGGGDTLLVALEGPVDGTTVEKVAALEGVASAVAGDGGILVRLDGATPAALIAELVRLDVPVSAVGPHRRLEDAFLTLIGGTA